MKKVILFLTLFLLNLHFLDAAQTQEPKTVKKVNNTNRSFLISSFCFDATLMVGVIVMLYQHYNSEKRIKSLEEKVACYEDILNRMPQAVGDAVAVAFAGKDVTSHFNRQATLQNYFLQYMSKQEGVNLFCADLLNLQHQADSPRTQDLREKTIGLLNWARQEQDKLYKDMLYRMQLDLERASRPN